MTQADVRKIQPADLRRVAAQTREPERERKMLALAEQLEEREAATTPSVGQHENGTPR
jgi:hypothetical protein